MKYVVLFFLTIYSTANFAQGIDFEQITFEKALEKAKVEDKIIFVDAYASWCGPCKAMARNVFTLKTVGDFYNKSFINLKLDMEKPEGAYVLRNYPVNAYPTLLFIDADGKLIHKKVGGMDDRNFLGLGKMVLEKTNDILASLGKQKNHQFLIGFALETENEIENAKRSQASGPNVSNAIWGKERAQCSPCVAAVWGCTKLRNAFGLLRTAWDVGDGLLALGWERAPSPLLASGRKTRSEWRSYIQPEQRRCIDIA